MVLLRTMVLADCVLMAALVLFIGPEGEVEVVGEKALEAKPTVEGNTTIARPIGDSVQSEFTAGLKRNGGSGNYTLLFDDGGGQDQYSQDINDPSDQTRGWAGARLIDR